MNKFSENAERILHGLAKKEALQTCCPEVLPEHIVLAIWNLKKCRGYSVLNCFSEELKSLKNEIYKFLQQYSQHSVAELSLENFDGQIPEKIVFGRRIQTILDLALMESMAFGDDFIGTEHILIAIVRESGSLSSRIFSAAGIDLELLRKKTAEIKSAQKKEKEKTESDVFPDFLNEKFFPMNNLNNLDELLFGAKNANSSGDDIFFQEHEDDEPENDFDDVKVDSFFNSCTRDLTLLAGQNKLDPVIGREKEINRMIQILSRRTKNNPCLVGEPGVGKTAIAEGLAQHIVQGDVPDGLLKKHILALDLAAIVAGTKFRGEFEDRMKRMISILKKSKNIILFIDEVHTIIGAGGQERQMDAANLLKPALSRGEIQIIGATTVKEYTKYIEKDSALERRFQKINIEEPSDKDTEKILEGIKPQFEKFHGVIYENDVVPLIVKLSRRYINERWLPDKAIDILDEAGAQKKITKEKCPLEFEEIKSQIKKLTQEKLDFVKFQDFENAAEARNKILELKNNLKILQDAWQKKNSGQKKIVTTHDVCRIIGEMTGIPVEHLDSSETERLLNMENELHRTVIGQDEAVRVISSAIRRNRTGISSPRHPIGSFVFLGPTGVGKTQLAKALAKFIFGSEEQIIRVDMSDFMEKHNVSRLVGAPPGYIGYEEGGILTEKVRRHPYSVILLDEIEKAHPDVFNLLLQILEEGELTDNLGHTVNFRNTIIIMTSNAGARQITSEGVIGFSASGTGILPYSQIKTNAVSELKKIISPELLNRIDDVVVFNALEKAEISRILDIQINELSERLSEKSLSIVLTRDAKEYLVENGYEPSMGARPMRRLIQKEIEEPLSIELLARNDKSLKKVSVELVDNRISVHLEKEVLETAAKITVLQAQKETVRK